MYKRVHKLSERLGKERDGLCVPMYTIEDRRHTEPGHFEEYQLVPVYDGHGVTQWRPRSDVEAIPTPQCTARTHTHCGETAQKRGQQAQKVSSSSGGSGSKGLEGRTGTPASQTKSKAPTAPNANNCCPRYSFGDHPPPYDAVMTQQSCWIPLYDSIGADEKVLDVEDDDYKEKAL